MAKPTATPPQIALIGCGAVSELYYGPALATLQTAGELQLSHLLDPSPDRIQVLKQRFPKAQVISELNDLEGKVQLAIVASPVKFHSQQTQDLLKLGLAVLCEKPMAATVAEAEPMLQAATDTGSPLGIGLFRRFFPAAQTIRALIHTQTLGAVRSFQFTEGGRFNWPAKSAAFFQKPSAPGGVLFDLGVHLLDLVIWWFGWPDRLQYQDDAMGSVEINSLLQLSYSSGVSGSVQMSWDWSLPNRYVIQFDKGWVRWSVGKANQLEIGLDQIPYILDSTLHEPYPVPHAQIPLHHQPLGSTGRTYQQSFMEQIRNLIRALEGQETLQVDGSQGILSLKLIEQCYQERQLLDLPWLTQQEYTCAEKLSG